jgi:methylthioribose-1-phosphate isomerase
VAQLVEHIHALRVRGAIKVIHQIDGGRAGSTQDRQRLCQLPLRLSLFCQLSASLLLALLAEQGQTQRQLAESLAILRAARPTAVNLMNTAHPQRVNMLNQLRHTVRW